MTYKGSLRAFLAEGTQSKTTLFYFLTDTHKKSNKKGKKRKKDGGKKRNRKKGNRYENNMYGDSDEEGGGGYGEEGGTGYGDDVSDEGPQEYKAPESSTIESERKSKVVETIRIQFYSFLLLVKRV